VLLERRGHSAQSCARAGGGHTAPRQIPQPSATRRSRTHGSPSVRRSNGLHCVAHSNPCRPTKDQTGLPFSINITAGANRKLPLPASFGSCPPYRCTRRSTDPYKDRSAQKTGSGWRDRPPASPHRNSDHALDLPIDESFLCGPRTAAWAACPPQLAPFVSLTHSRSGWPGSRQRASARCAACRRTPEMPFSSTGPISVKVTSTPAEASTTSWLTRTSPGRAYSAIREARFTVRP
jgi:hypothetical protein